MPRLGATHKAWKTRLVVTYRRSKQSLNRRRADPPVYAEYSFCIQMARKGEKGEKYSPSLQNYTYQFLKVRCRSFRDLAELT